jgi:16S rRNA (guanine527-N7)-methyltransferase
MLLPTTTSERSWFAATDEIDCPLDAVQRARFDAYRDLLLDWNRRFNLTAITEPAEVERRLFLDALRMVPAVDAYRRPVGAFVGTTTVTDTPVRLVDVGSGAGFPGLPLKIARPDLDVLLVEATGKKVAFLDRVIAELGLTGVSALHARAEAIGQDEAYRATFDLATARAVAALPALLELCLPLLRVGGRALLPKSATLGDELLMGRRAATALGGKLVGADLLPASETRLVVVDQIGPTPRRYPRRPGVPTKEPLGGGAR